MFISTVRCSTALPFRPVMEHQLGQLVIRLLEIAPTHAQLQLQVRLRAFLQLSHRAGAPLAPILPVKVPVQLCPPVHRSLFRTLPQHLLFVLLLHSTTQENAFPATPLVRHAADQVLIDASLALRPSFWNKAFASFLAARATIRKWATASCAATSVRLVPAH